MAELMEQSGDKFMEIVLANGGIAMLYQSLSALSAKLMNPPIFNRTRSLAKSRHSRWQFPLFSA